MDENMKSEGKHAEKNEKQNAKAEEAMELTKQVDTLKIQLEETDDRLKRVAAEFDNYKKRSSKEKENIYDSLKGDIIATLLPVIDNLEKAVEATTEDAAYKQGVNMVLKQFQDVLQANGVTEIEAVGKTFDPEYHEAVSLVVDGDLGEKEIKEEYRKGYKIGDRVIRHSMVIVAN